MLNDNVRGIGIGIRRVVSILIDGMPVDGLIKTTVVEFTIGIIGIVMLLKYKDNN
jgi:hypothetical protein